MNFAANMAPLPRYTLSTEHRQFLSNLLDQARSPVPSDWLEWWLEGIQQPLGILSPQRAELLAQWWPRRAPLVRDGHRWMWKAGSLSPRERSQVLQSVAEQLHSHGHVWGWRNELYEGWGKEQASWPDPPPALFRLERAAYRFFGLRSHAAHVHGVTHDGRMWCGRRSTTKATDPGMLDNMAAGGLPEGEVPVRCAKREIHEEAGLVRAASQLVSCGAITTERAVPEGWHSETIFVYVTTVADTETPRNLDGEVSDYVCLEIDEVLSRMRDGEFTHDAACAIAVYLLNRESRS